MTEEEYAAFVAQQRNFARTHLRDELVRWRRLYWTWGEDPIDQEDELRRWAFRRAVSLPIMLSPGAFAVVTLP